MQRTPLFDRILIVIGLCIAILLPIVLYVMTNPRITTLLPSNLNPSKTPVASDKYIAQSELSGYTLKLADTQFLDYISSILNIYKPNAVADPIYWRKGFTITQRKSISRMRFILVSQVQKPIGFVVDPTSAAILCRGGYDVDGNTLVIRVMFDFDAMAKAGKTNDHAMEDTFLNTVINTIYFAQGRINLAADRQFFDRLYTDKQYYLYSGLFVWPFRIEHT